nr:reverse transcriptase domain-containing protein [Tanacetum cinerariifolium]
KEVCKNLVEIHDTKQRDEETIEEFMERFKIEIGRMKGSFKCMRISGFMHGVNNPELTKRLNERVPKTVEEMMTATMDFIWGETIEELVRAEKLSHFIKEIRQDRDQLKTRKKDSPIKDKAAAIYMIRLWQRVTRQKVTQSSAHVKEITFPPLTTNKGTEGPLVIEAEIGGHAIHRIYVDGGSSMEVLYKHCFNQLQPHEIREIQAVPSTAHGMLKFSVNGEIVTIRNTILTPTECTTIATTPKEIAKKAEARHGNFKVAIHPDFPDQEITIGGTISTKARTELSLLLKRNLDIFAWQPSDMTGMPTKALIKYRWPNKMRKRRLATLVTRQIDRNLEIYVDDLVIKSQTKIELLWDIEETFRTLRQINMKLNPKKCTFGAAKGMFLGYTINPEGIKPCPDKTEAVLQLPSLRTIKEVQGS